MPFPALLAPLLQWKGQKRPFAKWIPFEKKKERKEMNSACRWICGLFWWQDTWYGNFAAIEKVVCVCVFGSMRVPCLALLYYLAIAYA